MSIGSTCPLVDDLTFIQGENVVLGGPIPEGGPPSIVVVEFWATWCPPCRETIPHLSKVYAKYKDRGVKVLGITNETADKANEVLAFVKAMDQNMNYSVAFDHQRTARKALFKPSGSPGIPTAFILVNNKVIWVGQPVLDKDFDELLEKAVNGTLFT